MVNPASFIRSAARATFSAYRTLPIRWRLAGGSAVLTLVILMGFAAIVGVLTQRRIYSDFDTQVERAADKLQSDINLEYQFATGNIVCTTSPCPVRAPDAFAGAQDGVVRFVDAQGRPLSSTTGAPDLGAPQTGRTDVGGYRVETRSLPVTSYGFIYVQYARRLSDVRATVGRVRVFLGIGVLGGSLLALLAGLANARRAMRPVAQLTDAARNIERTRDPSLTIPKPLADDEVRELADTLEDMLHSLDDARAETESALTRQREFVADASHELRTPLTAVLANLELLEEEFGGRSTRHRRRRAALDPPHAPAGRRPAAAGPRRRRPRGAPLPRRPLGGAWSRPPPSSSPFPVTIASRSTVTEDAIVAGARDELHRLALNLMDNALKHTDSGTEIRATVDREGDRRPADRRGRRPGRPRRHRPEDLRALRTRRLRPRRLQRSRPLDRARRRGNPRRHRDARNGDLGVRRPVRGAAARSRLRTFAFFWNGQNLNAFLKLARWHSSPKRLF